MAGRWRVRSVMELQTDVTRLEESMQTRFQVVPETIQQSASVQFPLLQRYLNAPPPQPQPQAPKPIDMEEIQDSLFQL